MPGGDHGHLVDEAEVLQVGRCAAWCLRVRADDGAALEGVEHLGGMKAQHGQVAVVQELTLPDLTPKACAAS